MENPNFQADFCNPNPSQGPYGRCGCFLCSDTDQKFRVDRFQGQIQNSPMARHGGGGGCGTGQGKNINVGQKLCKHFGFIKVNRS